MTLNPLSEPAAVRRPMIGVATLREHLGGASLPTLNRWIRAGIIPPPIKFGQTRLWPATILDDLTAGRIGTAPAPDDLALQ